MLYFYELILVFKVIIMVVSSDNNDTIIIPQNELTIYKIPRKKRPVLIQYSGKAIGRRYLITSPEVLIGRLVSNNKDVDTVSFLTKNTDCLDNHSIFLDDPTVSRRHAKIYHKGNSFFIEDLDSRNGTYVNEKQVNKNERELLQNGDLIKLGTVVLKFYTEETIDIILQDKILQKATIDGGTQVFNKGYLLEVLNWEFKYSRVSHAALSIILYDLDFFKKVNDTYGHTCGDFILKESAHIVKSVIRKEDIFGRYGGEEFCIILPGTDLKVAYDLAERIRQVIESHTFVFKNLALKQTISVGVAQATKDMKKYEDLIDLADKNLYKSKQEGRNRVSI